jgi:hypothetical protein
MLGGIVKLSPKLDHFLIPPGVKIALLALMLTFVSICFLMVAKNITICLLKKMNGFVII